jgi:copper(I)-binding protein
MKAVSALSLGVLLLAMLTLASIGASAGEISVSEPWARANPNPGGAGAAFMIISNAGGAADRLLGVQSPAARAVELHTHIDDGGVMRMREVDAIEVPAGGRAALAPGGLHVMLLGLTRPLQEGDTIALTLAFEKAGSISVAVPVLRAGAMGPQPATGAAPGTPAPGAHGGAHQ